MRHLFISFVIACSAAILGTAPASAQTYSKTRVIESFSENSLTAVVLELGATIKRTDDGKYQIEFQNGLKATAELTACTNGECLGTNLVALFGKANRFTVAENERFVRDFNSNRRVIKVFHRPDGKSGAQRYIIADEGITMGHYRRQISLFGYMLKQYSDELYNGS